MDFKLSKEQELLRDGLTKFLSTRYDLEKSRSAAKTGARLAARDLAGVRRGARHPRRHPARGCGRNRRRPSRTHGHHRGPRSRPGGRTLCRHGGGGGRTSAPRGRRARPRRCWRRSWRAPRSSRWPPAEPESGDRWQDVATTAERDGDGWILQRPQGRCDERAVGHHLLVTATHPRWRLAVSRRSRGGGHGLSLTGYRTIDDRRAADLVIDGLRLPAGALLGEAGQALPSLEQARDEGAAAICSEAVGCMRKVLADTVEYCKQRQQFGVADRQLPGAAASHGRHVHRAGTGRRRRLPCGAPPRGRARRPRAVGVGREGDGRAGPPASSASRPCNCTAAWA